MNTGQAFAWVYSLAPYLRVPTLASITDFLQDPIVVINLGLEKFAKSFEEQQVEVVQVDWVPPAGGDQEMIELLDQLL